MIPLVEDNDGLLLAVVAQPGAKHDEVRGEHSGALKVAVRAPPQDGRANAALLELLREALGLKRSQIELAAGATGKHKRFLVRGLSREKLASRLESILKR
jgi:uncharacterized protein (TIGR00251 family)